MRFILALVLTLVACAATPLFAQAPADLFVHAAPRAEVATPAAAVAGLRHRAHVRPVADVLRASPAARAPERIRLSLAADLVVVATQTHAAPLDAEASAWSGRLEQPATGEVAFVQRGRWLAGHIHVDGRTFLLQSHADGTHTLDEMDPASHTRCGGGRHPALADAQPSAPPAVGSMTPRQSSPPTGADAHPAALDLLVVYTPAARAGAGGTDALRTNIALGVLQMNEALANSQVAGQARLVGAYEVAYAESGSLDTDLNRLTATADTFMDDVHALRDQLGADLVVLVVDASLDGWAGLAWIMTRVGSDFAPYGFSVVRRLDLNTYTLAHEVGHNLGLAHNREDAPIAGVFLDAYGYRAPPYFRDLMSYACANAFCPRIAHFSNPQVTYQGRPTGRVNSEDAARALRVTLPLAAGFRQPPAPVLTGVTPARAPTLGGERVTLAGTSLGAVSRVRFGPYDATALTPLSSGELSVVVPPHPAGRVAVRVEDAAGRTSTLPDAFAYQPGANDSDGDALPDDWERTMGLDPASAAGDTGAAGDPDGDGITNFEAWRTHRHPRAFHRRYFAEGATSTFFDTRLALVNPGAVEGGAVLRYQLGDGQVRGSWLPMPARTRRTVRVGDVPGMRGAEFSTVVESDVPIVADRTMTWDGVTRYGSHAETSVAAPATTWYLAEGATHSGFALFYLLQNPAETPTTVRVRYLRQEGPPLEKTYTLAPTSRTNIWVNVESFGASGRALASAEVSAVIESLDGTPIIVERAMYLSRGGRTYDAGHASAGITTPSTEWFLAEGATGSLFDLFVLIANPGQTDAAVLVEYLLDDGSSYARPLMAAAQSRTTIAVDHEQFDGVDGFPLADTAVATRITSTNGVPVIVERAMWWPGPFASWYEAHNSAGSTEVGTQWVVADGELGGPDDTRTFLLLANTSAFAGRATVTLWFEDGSSASRTYDLPATSRTNVPVYTDFEVARGRRFSALVQSEGASPALLVVERAMYASAGGVFWSSGSNALATRIE